MKTTTIKLTSRKDILKVLKKEDIKISAWANEIISKIELTDGVEYEIAIVKVSDLGKSYPTTKEIRDYAASQGYVTPPAEVGLLMRNTLTDKAIEDMGLWYIVAMHDPIKDSGGDPRLLYSHRGVAGRWLSAYYDRPDVEWNDNGGFAFVVPQGTLKSGTKTSSDTLPLDLSPFAHCPNCNCKLSLTMI